MGFNDPKTSPTGGTYTGMRIGGEHHWRYTDARWHEWKTTPDRWDLRFSAKKLRRTQAPEFSGAEPNTLYHWLIIGHQRVRKVDADTYQTLLEATKFKIAHKRPKWRTWNTQYDGNPSARQNTIKALEQVLDELRTAELTRAPGLEGTLSRI